MSKKAKFLIFTLIDVFIVLGVWIFSLLVSGVNFHNAFIASYPFLIIAIAIAFIVNLLLGLYVKLWRHVSFNEAIRVMISACIVTVYFLIIGRIREELTFQWAVFASTFYLPLLVVSRFAVRAFYSLRSALINHKAQMQTAKRVLLVGAGSAGIMLVKEMKTSDKIALNPVCILDDNPNLLGLNVNGVKVVGKIDDVEEMAKKYNAEEIIIAIPSLKKKAMSEIIKKCQKTNLEIKILPGVYQLLSGQVSVSDIRKVEINDLLGRETVKVNLDEIMGYIENKVVLVTGGGGSIGSELCRQIASHNPKQLIIFDIYENNAYEIEQELKRKLPTLNLLTLIGSTRDTYKVDTMFAKYKPEIVFHAAAHKHVPLMETSPNEAVKNNVTGTLNVAQSAGKHGAKRFVLISTDKAVNPTNVMGATKRICEMIIQALDKRYDTEYVAVRFGNVLGSNGSVIPLFRRQIEEGGPVTVTHKDIVRYFMTIPEAVSLVLQAGAYAKGGEIFVLDMGEQVRIYDMALNMIKLSGLEPFKDIDVVVTGLRPGEKLYEERLMEEEGLQRTANEMISIGKPLVLDEENLLTKLEELRIAAYEETDKMKELVSELVPTYTIDKRQ